MRHRLAAAAFAAAATGLAWGLYEAQWVRFRRISVEIPGLPRALAGFTILHLSDLHLGTPSLSARALAKCAEWAHQVQPDLVVLTGDLLSRQRGERHLRRALGRLRGRHGVYAVLGNHDIDVTRDPLSETTRIAELALDPAVLLEADGRTFDVEGSRVQVVGCAPSGYPVAPPPLADPGADLRILLAHFPETADLSPPGAFHVILAGHMHAGQICLPGPRGKIRLLNPTFRYQEGLFKTAGGVLHVSPGLGTSLVPFRFLARPEATLLSLRPSY